jgi:hypothetical protein
MIYLLSGKTGLSAIKPKLHKDRVRTAKISRALLRTVQIEGAVTLIVRIGRLPRTSDGAMSKAAIRARLAVWHESRREFLAARAWQRGSSCWARHS